MHQQTSFPVPFAPAPLQAFLSAVLQAVCLKAYPRPRYFAVPALSPPALPLARPSAPP